MTDYDDNLKIMILGDNIFQRTSLINQYFYVNDLKLTTGAEFFSKTIDVIFTILKYISGILVFSINSIIINSFALRELNSSFSGFHL